MKNINNLINEYKQGNKEVFDNIFMQEERQIKDLYILIEVIMVYV